MDTKAGVPFKHILFSALIGLAAVFGVFALPVLMVLPAFLAFIACAWGMGCFALSCACAVAATALGCGLDMGAAAYMTGLFLPASVILALMISAKRPWRTAVGLCCAALCAGLYCVVCLPSLIAGGGTFDTMVNVAKDIVYGTDTAFVYLREAFSRLLPADYISLLPDLMPAMTTVFIMTLGMGLGFFDVIIARSLLKRAGAQVRPMAPMPEWQLTRSFSWGAVILLIGLLVIVLNNIVYSEAISAAIELIVMAPYMLMGVCFFEFTGRKRAGNRAVRRVLGAAALTLLMPYSLYGLALGGFIERTFRIRERINNPPPEF